MFRLLFIGDVVGRAGCTAVRALVPILRRKLGLDAIVANGENSAPWGRGITEEAGLALLEKVDFLTLGNHAFDAEEGRGYVGREPRVIRPTNMDHNLPGRGWGTFEAGGVRVGVASVQGRVFMRQDLPSPFEAADRAVAELEASGADLILVDVHAEATSEKQAMGYYLAGKVQAVVGTHTHVPTADPIVLPGDTAYVTDVGMTGSVNSIIGFNKDDFLDLFLERPPSRIEVAEGPTVLNAVVINIEVESHRVVSIERVYRKYT